MQTYSRGNPFLAAIKESFSLCQPGTSKDTRHIAIDIKGSGIVYSVGDCVAVLPSNSAGDVEQLFDLLRYCDGDTVCDPRSGEIIPARNYFLQQVNLAECTKKFLVKICQKQENISKKCRLEKILEEVGGGLNEYLVQNTVLDLLNDHAEVCFTSQELASLMKPMLPRFYSIASSMAVVGEEVHLTVALKSWKTNGKERHGVCTNFLCNEVPFHEKAVPLYIQPHKGFTLPRDPATPIIMVGPGTGVAPFRAFMQERESLNAPGKNWLFFGEWNRSHHFFYENYWRALESRGRLRLDTAFSRDQSQKVYVQHRMLEQGKQLYAWLQEGAYFYVCGDASAMAKDVEAALHDIICTHGGHSPETAREYVKALRSEKRYLRDVY